MISIMMSYYSELYTLGELKKVEAEIRYTSQKKNRYGENRLRADGLLEYPCRTLSGLSLLPHFMERNFPQSGKS